MRRLPSKNPAADSGSAARNARQSKGASTSSSSDCRQVKIDTSSIGDEDVEGYIDLTLISAQNLKDVKMFGSMSSYAVVWIDPSCKHHTCVAEHTGSSPAWDYFLCLPVHANYTCGRTSGGSGSSGSGGGTNGGNTGSIVSGTAISSAATDEDDEDNKRLTIQIYSKGAISDELVGTVHIPLQDITKNAADKLEYMACQLVRPSGRIQGLINLSVQYTPCTKTSSAHHHEHLCSSKMLKQHGTTRNSWFFLSESMDEEEGTGHEAGGSGGGASIAAPDYLDVRDGEGGAGGGGGGGRASHSSSSSATESIFVGSPHSPENSSGQSDVPSNSMFDNTFDALALADATVSVVHPLPGSTGVSVGDALLGLIMSQPSNPPSHGQGG